VHPEYKDLERAVEVLKKQFAEIRVGPVDKLRIAAYRTATVGMPNLPKV
jgi:hypothetical protein